MKNKALMVLIALTLTLSMVLGILAGCGTPATPTATVAPTGTATAKPTATATAKPTTTSAPTPTKAGEVIKWRFQSPASAGDATWWVYQEFVDLIKKTSGGRLELTLFPVGAIVARMEIFDSVSVGAVECGAVIDNDQVGKDERFKLCNVPAGMDHNAQLDWLFFRNPQPDAKGYSEQVLVSPGDQIFQPLFAKFNMMAFHMYTGSREVLYMANKRILVPADYKGSTFRASGWEQEVIADFGGKPVSMASSDVYSALQTGVIDATQVGGAYGNIMSGYQDITKYWGFPGMHNQGDLHHFVINMDVWKKLPVDLQEIVRLACQNFYLTQMAFNDVMDAWMVPQLSKYGLNVVYISPETQQMWRDSMLKTAAATIKKYPDFEKPWKDMMNFQYMIEAFYDLQKPVYGPDYPGRKEKIPGIVWK
jgi:TRAP-type mannitol/chloroaromatic compound transport system substrate-binding protein